MGILGRLRDAMKARRGDEPAILVQSDGFTFGDQVIDWSDVNEISALKLDLLTTDEIRIVFGLRSGSFVEVSEEQLGFDALDSAMQTRFPSTHGWFAQVSQPAFARNETILYVDV
jgi:hypothetical protein